MLLTIGHTFFYALWQAFAYSIFTLGLFRAGFIKRQRRLKAFFWLLAINICGTVTFGETAWQHASKPVAAVFILVALVVFVFCHLYLAWRKYHPHD